MPLGNVRFLVGVDGGDAAFRLRCGGGGGGIASGEVCAWALSLAERRAVVAMIVEVCMFGMVMRKTLGDDGRRVVKRDGI